MWATTVTPAANALGIPPSRLSNWVRLRKFDWDDVQYPFWDKNKAVLQKRRLFPQTWLDALAKEIDVVPNWDLVPPEKRIEIDA